MATNYKWTVRFGVVSPIFIITCILLMGGGHGWYTPTMILFPWATINTAWQDHLSMPFTIVGAFQFILYGFLIDKTMGTKSQHLVIFAILISHIILTIIILWLRSPEWR